MAECQGSQGSQGSAERLRVTEDSVRVMNRKTTLCNAEDLADIYIYIYIYTYPESKMSLLLRSGATRIQDLSCFLSIAARSFPKHPSLRHRGGAGTGGRLAAAVPWFSDLRCNLAWHTL